MPNQTVTSTGTAGGRRPGARKSAVLAICCLSLFMVGIDNTIVNVALPSIQHSLGASVSGLQWTVDAYLLVLASLLMLSGSLGDRFGRQRVFRVGLVVFATGSLLCSLAPNLEFLVVFRMLQAVGGSMLNPNALSIITNTYTEPTERARAVGVWSAMFGVSIAAGPVLGGALVELAGWPSIFWVNLPVSVAAFVLTTRYVPDSRAPRARRIDPPGQVLMIALLATLTYAVIEGPSAGWGSPLIVGLFAAAAATGTCLVAVELRRDDPLINVRFFRSVPFSGATVTAILAYSTLAGFLFLNTLYLQDVRGASALVAGLSTLPLAVAMAVAAGFAGRILGRGGPRFPLVVAGLTILAGAAILTTMTPTTSFGILAVAYVLLGVGFGMVSPPITNTAVSGMPREQAGVASAVASASRQVGQALGVALTGSLVTSAFRSRITEGVGTLSLSATARAAVSRAGLGQTRVAGVPAGHGVTQFLQAAFTDASHTGWWLLIGCGAAIVAVAMLVTTRWAFATAARTASRLNTTAVEPAP
jgi:EmrB/QacA subfamily drug resistance transporter